MLRDCLNAILAATAGLFVETYVVDNNSPDGSAEMTASEFPEVRLIANRDNAGFTKANNQALSRSVGRHVLILNPDTEARPDSLSTLVRFLDDHPKTGVVGLQLLNTDGSLQKSGCRFPSPWREFLDASGLRYLNDAAYEREGWGRDDFSYRTQVDSVSGACLMVRGETMK